MLDAILDLSLATARIRSSHPAVKRHVEFFYASRLAAPGHRDTFIDLDVRVLGGSLLRAPLRPQARFLLDHVEPFLPLPATQAAPLFEWGLNWALAARPLGYLVIHAAVVARDDTALVMPGTPGAGKSTLAAALTFLDGWRILSDELAILEPRTGILRPCPRPFCVKNDSIELARAMPGARLGPVHADTRKGTVAHLAVPTPSLDAANLGARCRWIVFPQYAPDTPPFCEELGQSEAFARIAEQSFNRDRMGEAGFRALCEMLAGARCLAIGYDSTERARALVRDITAD